MDPNRPGIAYLSYYSGGFRVLEYSRGGGLNEIGAFIDDDGSNFWGVEFHTLPDGTELVLGSDRDFGLFIFDPTLYDDAPGQTPDQTPGPSPQPGPSPSPSPSPGPSPAPGPQPGPQPGPSPSPAPVTPVDPFTQNAVRLSGAGRLETAVAISRDSYGDGEAATVVLARADIAPDALAGTPLAIQADGPLLLTGSDALAAVTAEEIERVLPEGETVHVLGGPNAIDESVVTAIEELGYDVVRVSGATRIETAVAIAERLGNPELVLIAHAFDFPDALAAGAAAGSNGGAVLLTTPEAAHPAVDAYLTAQPAADVFAIGGPAVRAYPAAKAVRGPSREETAIAVAEEFFDSPSIVGIARRDDFPDALAGGAHVGRQGGPVLLTPSASLHPAAAAYLCSQDIATVFVYGGSAAIAPATFDAIFARVQGSGCAG
jgi:hypothetical protein